MENVTQDIYGDVWAEINKMEPKLHVFDTNFVGNLRIAKFTTGCLEDAERLKKQFQGSKNKVTGHEIRILLELPSSTRRSDLFHQSASKVHQTQGPSQNFVN